MPRSPLTREQVSSVIEGRSDSPRIPMLIHFWVLNPERFAEQRSALEEILARYPMDAQMVPLNLPQLFVAPEDDPQYRWANFDDPYAAGDVAIDQRIALRDWAQLDGFLAEFPDPHYPRMFRDTPTPDGRYRLGYWWFWLFERHWSWRGMTNALLDYYTNPAEVHRMFRAVTDFYLVALERAKREAGIDGIMVSDDLGTQTGPFFSPRILNEFFRPYYQELVDKAHALGMHFWMHACGCITPFLPALIDIGVDVIHPIQKHTMDYRDIAAQFGAQISIWAGMDVQQVIPWGTTAEVRQEVRDLIDSFYRPEGRLLLAAGNAVHEDCPLPNLEAFLDEAYNYGTEVVRR